jgi:hypothetical protein
MKQWKLENESRNSSIPFRLASLPGIWYEASMKGSLMGRGNSGVGGAGVEAEPVVKGRKGPAGRGLRNEPNSIQAGVEKVILESQKRTQIWPSKQAWKDMFEVYLDLVGSS